MGVARPDYLNTSKNVEFFEVSSHVEFRMIQNIANCHELSVPECKQSEDIATKVFVTAIDDRNTQSNCRES